ncbi:hypothetical protein [Paraburkholderia ribeironis]|uniref:hypothetical protein n=1 Tax=Paraburkholderia ribeironis TaxID=1247936 RepID=UPI00117899F0|nr:hypothetical protein [Paraburkholderia ribeironis]
MAFFDVPVNLECRTKNLFCRAAGKIFAERAKSAFARLPAQHHSFQHRASTGRCAATATNFPSIVSFCLQNSQPILGAERFVQTHIFMRSASVRATTMHCRRHRSVVAMQKYSYLGNLPPSVVRLRVNV